MAAQVEGLGTIPSIDVLKSELDSAIGTDYTIEETDDGWQVIANKSAFNIDKNGGTEKTEYFDAEEWDKTAATEDCFYWASDDPTSEDYGTVIGYTAKIQGYTLLRFPCRCTKIEIDNSIFSDSNEENDKMRAFSKEVKKVELPETVVEIGYGAFFVFNFEDLEDVNIPNSVTNIGDVAFCGCENLTKIALSNNVKAIGDEAFGEMGLTEITIPCNCKSIAQTAFLNCKSLKKVLIMDGVENIGTGAFAYCKELTEIIIPISVVNMRDSVFLGCTNLQNINVKALSIPSTWSSYWNNGCSATVNLGYTGE